MKKRFVQFVIFLAAVLGTASAQVTITNVYVSASTATTATINWTTSGPATSQVLYGFDPSLPYSNSVNYTQVTSHSMTLTVLNASQDYYFAVKSVDGAGHSTQSTTAIFGLCGQGMVPVTGTVNNYYEYGSFTMTWVPPAGAPGGTPTVCGVAFNQTVSGVLSGGASLSASVADSYRVIPGPGQWHVSVTDPGNLAPISLNYPLSTLSNDISSQLQALGAASGLINCQTNTIGNTFFPSGCGGGGGGSNVEFQHNDSVLGGQFAANPQIFDLNDTTPAADPGYINGIFKTDTATGRVSVEVPALGGIQTQIIPPVAGQYVIIYPTEVVAGITHGTTGTAFGTGSSGSGSFATFVVGPHNTINGFGGAYQFGGYGPAFAATGIPAGNVTTVYAQSLEAVIGPIDAETLGCSYTGGSSGFTTIGPYTVQSQLTGLTGANISTVACGANPQSSISTSVVAREDVTPMALIVYYTGSPVAPSPDTIQVSSPLTVIGGVLGINPLAPFPGLYQLPYTVATLPSSSTWPVLPVVGAVYNVVDPISDTDCTVGGGGPGHVSCQYTLSGYVAVDIGGGGGSSVWSALTNPTTNLSLSMGADTSTFTFGSATGTTPWMQWLNSAGTGWGIAGDGSLRGQGTSASHGFILPAGSGGPLTPVASSAGVSTDSSGNLESSDAGGAFSRVCNVGNFASICGGGSGSNPILPSSGNFISAGDSLCSGHGLSTGQDWPTLLGGLPVFTGVTVTNTCVDGNTLAGMTSGYTSAVHPHTFAVTGKACIVAISIYGNDIALISSEGIAAYEASYATYVGMAHTDGCKVMFMEQWAQTGRQAEDVLRLQFNEYNRVGGSDYFLSTVGRMNDPANTEMYQGDGLHETLIGSTYVATQAQVAVYGGGQGFSQGNTAYENPLQPQPITVNTSAGDALIIRNTANNGWDSISLNDDTGTNQGRIGWANSGATSGETPASAMVYTVNSGESEHVFSVGNSNPDIFCIDAVEYGSCLNNAFPMLTSYSGGSAGTQISTFAAGGYNYRMSTADQSGAKVTLGYQNGTGYGNTRTYTDLFIVNHSGAVTNGNASFSVDQAGNMAVNSCTGCGGSTGLSGMTATQVPIAATATTVTSSVAASTTVHGATCGLGSTCLATLPLSCQPGLGDGLNAIPAGTYLTTSCRNETGATWTLTAIRCVADSGSSTCNVTNGAGTALLTGAITGSSTYANGTQSGTTTIASGDYLKITYVADGTSKQIGIDVAGTY